MDGRYLDPSVLLLSITSDNPEKPQRALLRAPFGVMERPDFRQTDRTCLYRSVSTISTTADTLSTRPIMRVSRVTPRMLIA